MIKQVLLFSALIQILVFSSSTYAERAIRGLCILNESSYKVLVVYTNGYKVINSNERTCANETADFYASTIYKCVNPPGQCTLPKYHTKQFSFQINEQAPYFSPSDITTTDSIRYGTINCSQCPSFFKVCDIQIVDNN